MVDLKKQGQQSNAQEKSDNKNEQRYQRKGFRSEEKKKDPDAIPILKYGPSNNFSVQGSIVKEGAIRIWQTWKIDKPRIYSNAWLTG